MLAVSGIDNSIKIFSPDQIARQNAREGVTARHPNPRPNRRLIAHHTPRTDPRFAARGPASIQESDDEDAEDAEDRIATNGLQSRKRLHLEYQITAENEHMLQHPRRGGFIPVSLALARLLRYLR
jgi:nuclear receptor interaction protein